MAFDALPSGVRLVPDIIDEAQEAALLRAVDAGAWETCGTGHRSQQFGWWRPHLLTQAGQSERFLGALPDWAAPLVSRLHLLAPFDRAPDHLVVRELGPGADPQLRRGEGHIVAMLALAADLPLMFRRRSGAGQWHLLQARRSLLVLTERFDRDWDRTILPQAEPGPQSVAAGPVSRDAEPPARRLTLTFRRVSQD